MKKTLFLLTLTALCVALIYPPQSFAQTFIDGQMPDTFLAGHTARVSSVAFSPDGTTLASGSDDDTIKLWDVATGTLKATLEGHTESVNSVAFSPDSSTLASGSGDKTIKLWDVATGTLKATLEAHESWVYSVAFSPDGTTLASGNKLWDVATGTLKATLGRRHLSTVKSVAFSPDGSTLAIGVGGWIPDEDSYFGECSLWDVVTGTRIKSLEINADAVYGVAFSPDGKTLASVGIEYARHEIHDLSEEHETADLLGYLLLYGNLPVTLKKEGWGRYYDDWDYMEVRRGTIDLWDVASGSLKATLEAHTANVDSVAFSPDGQTLASGSSDNTVKLWDVTRQPKAPKAALSTHGDSVFSVAFSPDGKFLASGSGDGAVRLWRALPPADGDGVVNIADLVEVAQNFGQVGDNEADINGDGIVNIVDLILVAVALGEGAAAPAAHAEVLSTLTAEEVAEWLTQAKQLQTDDPIYLRGIRVLEQLHKALIPTQTALLANYPNPFNPETWIPYQLAEAADVTMTLYAADGRLVRTLALGYQSAGLYHSRTRAAYWDGRNEFGEPVASGIYFYMIKAGEFTATRKMLIRK